MSDFCHPEIRKFGRVSSGFGRHPRTRKSRGSLSRWRKRVSVRVDTLESPPSILPSRRGRKLSGDFFNVRGWLFVFSDSGFGLQKVGKKSGGKPWLESLVLKIAQRFPVIFRNANVDKIFAKRNSQEMMFRKIFLQEVLFE